MGKKRLDQLFQEKLKDYSEMPDDKVWHAIETSLDQKKKSHKVIPIWWKLGGVAAVLTIALFVINPFEKDSGATPTVTDVNHPSEKTVELEQPIKNTKSDFENATSNETQIVVIEQGNGVTKEKNSSDKQGGENGNANTKNLKSETLKSVRGILKKVDNYESKVATNTSKPLEKEQEVSKKYSPQIESDLTPQKEEAITDMDNKDSQNQRTKVTSSKNSNPNDEFENGQIGKGEKEEVAQIEKKDSKKSIFDEIAAQEEEKEVLANNSGSKWSAGPSIAPVYFNAIGEGSPVHSKFAPNSKSGEVSLSYGLSVAYEINKKLSIRSGIHKVDYGYNTNDVEFSSSVEASANRQIDNVDFALTAKNLVVNSKLNAPVAVSNQNSFLDVASASSEISAASVSRDGVMEQQFGYVEVPVELNYALVDNRFGINLIGGVSSLFLIDNSVSLTSGELTTEMGEANNMNAVNFSTNVGFGVNYKFTPKVKFNIEPVFKYQLNTFSTTAGSFQPFSVGVYSGLTFKF